MLREIVYDNRIVEDFKPLLAKTRELEEKLSRLTITADGRIQGTDPAGNGRGTKKVAGVPLILSQDRGRVIIIDRVRSSK